MEKRVLSYSFMLPTATVLNNSKLKTQNFYGLNPL